MTTTTDIKFEFYIDSTSDQDTSTSLSPADATDLGLNAGVVVDQLGGGITFSNAGSIKGGKTAWDVGIGFWLGYQNNEYRVAIGDPANEKVTWDGDDLVIDIDSSNLTVNGGTSGQVLSVDGSGTITFVDNVENLDDLGDVTGTTYTSGTFKILTPQAGNTYGFADLRSVTDSYVRLRDLVDVSNTGASSNQFLIWNGTAWEPSTTIPSAALAGQTLNNHSDVTLSSVAQNDLLQYNGSNWVNVTGDSFPYSLGGTGGTGGALGADPKIGLFNGSSTSRGEIRFARGNNIQITRSGNTFTFESTASASTIWTQTGNDIYYNSGNVAIGTSSPHSTHPLKIMGTLFTQGTSSSPGLNGIILDSRTTGGNNNQWWQLNQEPGGDLHLTRNANAANALKVGRSTGTFMIPAGICLNGTVTYDASNVLDDYEEGSTSQNFLQIYNTATGGSGQPGSTHLDSNFTNKIDYVKVGNVVHISFTFKIDNTANLNTNQAVYIGLPFTATGFVQTGVVNVIDWYNSSGSSNYNARLEHAYSFVQTGSSRMGIAYNQAGSTATLFTLGEIYGNGIRGSVTYLTS